MDAATTQLIVALVGLVIQYGVPAVISAIDALEKDSITLDDLKTLRGLIKPPEQY